MTHEYLQSCVNLQIQKVKVREDARRATHPRLPKDSARTPSIGHRYSSVQTLSACWGSGEQLSPHQRPLTPLALRTSHPGLLHPNVSLPFQSSNEVTLDPSLAMRMRANTVSGVGVGQYLSSAMGVPQRTAPPPPSVSHIMVNRRTFAQIHSEYGVPILRDKELYLQCKAQRKGGSEGKGGSAAFKSQEQEKAVSSTVVTDLIDI